MAYTFNWGKESMEIIETLMFTKRILNLLSDDEYKNVQSSLITNPTAGRVIKGGNGLRKLRWAIAGSGKSGGIRIIYFYLMEHDIVYMIFTYKKTEQEDLTKAQLKTLANYVKEGVL